MRTTPNCLLPCGFTRGWAGAFVALLGISISPFAVAAPPAKIDSNTRQAILDCTFEVLAQLRGTDATAPAGSVDRAALMRGASPTGGAAPTGRALPMNDASPMGGAVPTGGALPMSGALPMGGAAATVGAAPLLRVAGSAFCVGDRELATAAHVFDQVLGGRFEVPYVRDRAGRTYPVEKILRYSMRDDFVVFTVAGLTPRPARPHNVTGEIGKPLYLAWRRSDGDIAFGRTQYRGRSTVADLGRDGWIQFGPSPGHGASGAALLDDQGRVIGLINSRSTEKADAQAYAVPIQLVEAASTEWADIAIRDPLRTLGMPSERNMPLVGGIPLPAPLARFEKHMIEVRKTYFAHMLPYSLSLGGAAAPMSDVQRLGLCVALEQGYCVPDAQASMTQVRAARRPRGCEAIWTGVGAALVRCGAPDSVAASRMAEDARAQSAAMSMGRRYSLAPPAPCTSEDELESVAANETFADHIGAEWTVRTSPVRACDWVVLSMSRATADGTLTFVRGAPSAYADAAAMQLKALTAIRRDGNSDGDGDRDGEIKDAVLAGAGGVQSEMAR